MLRRSYYPLVNPQTVTVTTTSGVEASRPTTPAAIEGAHAMNPRIEEPWNNMNNMNNIGTPDRQGGTPPASVKVMLEKEYR